MWPKWRLNDYAFFLEKSHQSYNSKKQNKLIQYAQPEGGVGAIPPPPPLACRPKCTKKKKHVFWTSEAICFCDMDLKAI